MNTWGYLISIAALLLLAGVMLYARFASRSKGKSLHHPPVEWGLSHGAASQAPLAEKKRQEASSALSVGAVLKIETACKVAGETRDRDYLDELQEAAAGLAKLMRSSPVARTEPVVYAPLSEALPEDPASGEDELDSVMADLEDVVAQDSEVDLPESADAEDEVNATDLASVPEQVVLPTVEEAPSELAAEIAEERGEVSEELTIVEEAGFTVAEPVVAAEESDPVLDDELAPVRSLAELLGENVAEQFSRIDEALDVLESLVLTLEAGLSSLAQLESDELAEIPGEEEEGRVAEAA